MGVLVSKGFLVFAQNTDTVDYVRQAYALALSIKFSQPEINSVSLLTNSVVPEQYQTVFDQIIPIPWYDETVSSDLKAEHRWKLYHASPYTETIVLDADMLMLADISSWWEYCSNYDIKFCNKIKNYKNEEILQDTYHRKTFISNELNNPYYALHYFKQSDYAHDFYKLLEFVINNWEYCRGTFAPLDPQQWVSMDLAVALASKIYGIEDDVQSPLEFVHMKPAIQGWSTTPVSWKNFVNYVLNKKGEFVVGNIKQEKLFHYIDKDSVDDKLINRLEELANGT
jgi:hypothetical protein